MMRGTSDLQIKPGTPVVCAKNAQLAVVDRMEGSDTIKLKADKQGKSHYIPLSWVTKVDAKVHLDRDGADAMRDWSTSPMGSDQAMQERATNEGMRNLPNNNKDAEPVPSRGAGKERIGAHRREL